MRDFRQIMVIFSVAPLLVMGMGGCANSSDSPLPDASTRPISELATPGELAIDIDVLEQLLPRVFSAMHWGNIRVVNELTALSAAALTPDDRTVRIAAQKRAEGIAVQCRVGEFGDVELEGVFLATLHEMAENYESRRR